MKKLFTLIIGVLLIAGCTHTELNTDCQPYVRWWWNGDKVEAEELVRELHLLKEQGIGGVEINPIQYPDKTDPLNKKELMWLSDEWIDMLKVVFDEADRLGMKCDLIVGSGWPFGSETLPMEDRAEVMLTWAQPLEGGSSFEITKQEIYKEIDPGVTISNEDRVFSTVCIKLTPDPIDDLSQVIDLTDSFPGDSIRVEVPEGPHYLYVMVNVKSFACVINGAPGAAGSILNHMDPKAVRRYLDHMSDGIESRIGPLSKHLRAFFVDSMELEGCNWTEGFAEEFRRRRGYDIMPWLPFTMFKVGRLGDVINYKFGAVKGDDFNEQVKRARFDFELTKAEIYQDNYTATFLQWCRDKGVKSRAQAYGRGFFPLESSLGYDIPEGESWTTNWLKHRPGEEMGDEDYRRGRAYTMINKYVSSAANLTGKREVTSEEMTNTYRVFTTTLEQLKIGSDMGAFSGTTHSIWSGFNYSPQEAAFPGWVQYGSFYNEYCPWWPYWRLLNDYRSRISSLIMNADMVTDIALLPANYDLWRELGCQTDPFPWYLNVPYTSLIWEAIHKNGGGADYVSENILRQAKVRKGKLCWGAKAYRELMLIEVTSLSQESADKLLKFVKQGGRVFCIGKYPEKSLGLKDFEARDLKLQETVKQLQLYPDNFILLEKPEDGRYLEWYAEVMKRYDMPHAIGISNPDRFLLQNHYRMDDGTDLFLLSNVSLNDAKQTDIIFPDRLTKGRNTWIMDPDSGEKFNLPLAEGCCHLKMGPSETYVIGINSEKPETDWQRLPECGQTVAELNAWDLTLEHTQLGWMQNIRLDRLGDVKDMEAGKDFMGYLYYKTEVNLQGELPEYINLGKVCDICELTVNGKPCGTRWYGWKVYDLRGLLHEGMNTIEVKVTTVSGNYTRTLTDSYPVKRFMIGKKKEQPLSPLGMIGPVILYN